MGNINDWVGTIGGTILGLELILLLVVVIAINAALAYGLWWVLRKVGFVHTKIVFVQGLVTKYVDRATSVIATPVIVTTSVWRGIKGGVYRATHWRRVSRSSRVPALPSPAPDPSRTEGQSAA